MDQSVMGGTFRSRLSAARLFGLIETSQARVSLTQLGREVSDEVKLHDARVEAFLKPALFCALYERFMGHILPPPAAIERQIEELGVSPKQKERARQAFIKSAQYAGYIDPTTGRFVKPGAKGVVEDKRVRKDNGRGNAGGGGGEPPILDPLIAALIQKLPPAGTTDWPVNDRVMWLQMAAMAFQMAYGPAGTIEIKDPNNQSKA
jgi:hypothetical protein